MNSRPCLMLFLTIVLALATPGHTQSHKPGLWDVTTRTERPQAADPQGRLNGASPRPPEEESATLPVCYTHDLIDRYGIALPPSLRDCELLNVMRKPQSLTADVSCKGTFNGRGSLETTWTDANHAVGKVHFVSRSHGSRPVMLRWTQDLTAVYKSADCGGVRPRALPPGR